MTSGHARLCAVLRELRARTGLSLAALSQRTTYSKSSWERYLNGRSLPPRRAVQELCRLANEPEGRPLALWEVAERDWRGRAAAHAPTADEPLPSPQGPRPPQSTPEIGRPGTRRGRLILVSASTCALIVGGVALLLLLMPYRGTPEAEGLPDSPPYSLAPQCHGTVCEGRDPIRLVCGIAPDTLSSRTTATGAHVELRYSAKCGASWALVWGTRIGDRLNVTAAGRTHGVRIKDTSDTESYVYTDMTATLPGSTVRACFQPAAADGEQECVEAHVEEAATAAPRAPSAP